MSECSMCHELKPDSDFWMREPGKRFAHCKDCYNGNRRQRRAAKRAQRVPGERGVRAVRWMSNFIVNPVTGCHEHRAKRDASGYPRVRFLGAQMQAGRAFWRLKHGEIPAGLLVCHHCDNRTCCNVEHLFLGTHRDNMDDMVRKGRHLGRPGPRGARNARAKLNEQQVREIRARAAAGERPAALAPSYGMTVAGIQRVVWRKVWKHVA